MATSLTIGIGGSGGVFAPSLFIGATGGAAFGQAVAHAAPSLAGSAGTYALLGMGAVFAGAARAPITAVVIMFELTNEYTLILPLMVAIVLATGVSHLVSRDTIYTLKLWRRDVDLHEPPAAHLMRVTKARSVMRPTGDTISTDTGLEELLAPFGRARYGLLPVVDGAGHHAGMVTARAVAEALAEEDARELRASDLLAWPATVTPETSLEQCLLVLREESVNAVPVCEDQVMVGWVTADAVLDHWRATNAGPTLA